MARLLVRLKARLLANTLAKGTQQALGLVFAAVFGLILAASGFVMLAAGGRQDAWANRIVLVLAAAWVGWALLPMLTFTSDDTLDPRRFALLPVRPRALVPGLLASSFVGIGPVATALGLAGVVVGAARFGSVLAAVVAIAAAALLLLACLATSRAITTAASNLLASRRGRDLAVLLAAVLGVAAFLGFQAFSQWMTAAADVEPVIDIAPIVEVARWLPGGMAGSAIGEAAAGRYATALGWLGSVAAWCLLALAVWAWAMERIADRQPATSASGRSLERTSLYPALLRWLPRNRTTAVAMRFLRGLGRDVRVRTQALQHSFILFPMVVFSITGGAVTRPTAPLLAAMFTAPIGIVAVNQLGLDGPPLWQHELAGESPKADVLGRNLALAIVALPLAAIVAVALAVASGGWAYVPVAVVLSAATLAVLLGCANPASVLLPIPVPEASTNVFGTTQSGQGCVNGILSVVVLMTMAVLTVPILIAMVVLDGVAARAVGAVAALFYGLAVLWGGTLLGAARARGRGPELLVAVDPGRGS